MRADPFFGLCLPDTVPQVAGGARRRAFETDDGHAERHTKPGLQTYFLPMRRLRLMGASLYGVFSIFVFKSFI